MEGLKDQKKGSTLLELAVVVTSLLILITFGIVEFFNMRERAVRQIRIDGLKQLANAMELYKIDYAGYPLTGTITITHILRVYLGDWDLTKILGSGGSAEILATGGATCIRAQISGSSGKSITPPYNVNYCLDGGNTNRTFLTNQPTCCWTRGGVDCADDNNWYPCSSRL